RTGDLSGEGYDEVLLSGAKHAFVVLGDRSQDLPSGCLAHGEGITFTGFMDQIYFEHAKALGDIDGDGFPDLAIGYGGSNGLVLRRDLPAVFADGFGRPCG